MNTLLEVPAGKTEMAVLRHSGAGVAGNPCRIVLNRSSPMPLWLRARVQTIGFQRDDLERTHWKKLSHSMAED